MQKRQVLAVHHDRASQIGIGIGIGIGSIGEAVDNDPDPDHDFDFDLAGWIVLHCKT